MNNDEPIIKFGNLRKTLSEMGVHVPETNGNTYTIVDPQTVTFDDIKSGRLTVAPDKITLTDSDGKVHEGFIYKKYYVLKYGSLPVFHLCECSTIREFKSMGQFDSDYIFYNSSPVDVYDKYNHNLVKRGSVLRLCKNCIQQLRGTITYSSATTTEEYVQELRERSGGEENAGPVEVRENGETRDWEKIARKYRQKVHFTCESCKQQILSMKDKQRFLHVLHINGNKADNRDSNLKCLCPQCHYQSDIIYRGEVNTTPILKNELQEFIHAYKAD